jgi:CubicO group peptidase (beta-lactamase class C family)
LAIAFIVATGCSSAISAPTPSSIPTANAGCAPVTGTPAKTAAAFLKILAKAKAQHGLAAVIFSGTTKSGPILTTALGDSMPGVSATTAMHFRVGMAAEGFETTLLLTAIERGQIALGDRVSKWYPGYPYADIATVRMAAASSAGFGDYVFGPANPALHIPSFADVLYRDPRRTFTAAELVRRSRAPYQAPQFTTPGGDWMYSHTPYVMLGPILEQVTGKPYTTLIQETILGPLGLRDTSFSLASAIPEPVLNAYTSDRGRYENSTDWSPSWTSYSGAMTSNVCDLAAWGHALGTGALLTKGSFAEMTAPTNVGLNKNTAELYFGLGVIVNHGWLLASGNFFGWHTSTAYYIPTGTSLVVTVNEGPKTKDDGKLAGDILKAMSHIVAPDSPITK